MTRHSAVPGGKPPKARNYGVDYCNEYIALCADTTAAEPDLNNCVTWLRFNAAQAIASLEILRRGLARADDLVAHQTLQMTWHQELIPLMCTLRATLRTLGPMVETWDESQLCLKASASKGGA